MPGSRRSFLRATVAGLAAWGLRVDPVEGAPEALPAAEALYRRSLVIDALGSLGSAGPGAEDAITEAMLAAAGASGVTAINQTVGPVGNRPELEAFARVVSEIAFWDRQVDRHPQRLGVVRRATDLGSDRQMGRLGLIFGLQDGVCFESDLGRLETLHELGLRIVQPTYNVRNLLGDGCMEPGDAGLSRRGQAAVERMNALGILVDLSHCGRRTGREAIAVSRRPVAFTHTGCAALHDNPRNKTDEDLRALADKGGVVGIYFMPYLRASGQQMAEDVIRHLEHALKVAGEDHVGIGTDLSLAPVVLTPAYVERHREEVAERRRAGIAAPGEAEDVYLYVPDLNTPRRLETLAGLLLARGHSTGTVEKVLGANFARLFTEAWA